MWTGLLNIINTVSTLDTVVIIALISGGVTVLGIVANSIVSIILKTSEYRNKIKSDLRSKMEKPYSDFINLIFDILEKTKKSERIEEGELTKRYFCLSKGIILYGSNKVIKKWSIYKNSLNESNSLETITQLEDVLCAIREDLGTKKKGLKKGDILSLFVNDIKDVIKNKK